jgi:hypothetical protein
MEPAREFKNLTNILKVPVVNEVSTSRGFLLTSEMATTIDKCSIHFNSFQAASVFMEMQRKPLVTADGLVGLAQTH